MEAFDQSLITAAVSAIEPSILEPIIKRAADDFYGKVLDAAQDYLVENLDWNLKSHVSMLERENQRLRTELFEVDKLLGSFGLSSSDRLARIAALDAARAELVALKYELQFPTRKTPEQDPAHD